jgi:hypothetical protein
MPYTDDDVMKLADLVVTQLRSNDRSDIVQNIMSLASHLKLYGQQLEGVYGGMILMIISKTIINHYLHLHRST